MSQFSDEFHSACLIINARVDELHEADNELNSTVESPEKRTSNITSKEHQKQPKPNNDNDMNWSYERTDQKLTDLMNIIRKDQEDDKKMEQDETGIKTSNNSTDSATHYKDSNDPYIRKFGYQYHDIQTEMEQDETEPIIGYPNLMLSSSNVVPLSSSNDGNDRKNSISEDFGRINFEQNNQDEDDEHQNDESEDIETWDESALNNGEVLTTNPAQTQNRRPRATKAEVQSRTQNEKLEIRREGARRNTKNYYDRQKDGLKKLKENLVKAKNEMERMVNQKNDCEKNIATALGMIWEHMRYTLQDLRNRFEIQKQEYENAIKQIDDRFEIRVLKEQVEEARRKFNKAEADIALKHRNANTYSSNKCRAKNEKEKAEANLGLKTKKLEQNALTKHLYELQLTQSKIREHFIIVRDQIGLQGMMSMEPNNKTVFENLLTFFKFGNPVN